LRRWFFVPGAPLQSHQTPAKTNNGRSSLSANHVHTLRPVAGSGRVDGSQNEVTGTTQRFAGSSHRRQCGDDALRMFVTPGSIWPGFKNIGGDGIPHRKLTSSRLPPGAFLTTGATLSGKIAR